MLRNTSKNMQDVELDDMELSMYRNPDSASNERQLHTILGTLLSSRSGSFATLIERQGMQAKVAS